MKYADKLLKNLEKINWSEKVKIAQRNWIGKSEGALIKFGLPNNQDIEVFTTRPDTLFGATYMVLAPEHEIVEKLKPSITNWPEVEKYVKKTKQKTDEERIEEEKEKTGVELKGIKTTNPVTKKEIPIFIADYVLNSYGTGAIMAVPAHDMRDFAFAKKFNLPIKQVIENPNGETPLPYVEDGRVINSGGFPWADGLLSQDARLEIVEELKHQNIARTKIIYRLRDWLISRQRYWGPPIPMIFCEKCATNGKGEQKEMPGWYAVSEDDLPVELPRVKDFRPQGTGESPLASIKSFYEVKCPACGAKARRETDVSDTFLDSAWYYLRYLDSKNNTKPFRETRIKKWLPVHMYIGGAEHSVLHLLYIRFIAMALKGMKLLPFEEPIQKFRTHGLLIKDGAKMSKSKGNVINPDEYIKRFGADAFRMYLMFLAPFEDGGDFQDQGILGTSRFLERVWKLQENIIEVKNPQTMKLLHQTIKKVTEDIESLHYNTAISSLMILLNRFEKEGKISSNDFGIFLKLLAPFAPFITEELWRNLNPATSIHSEVWPIYDPKKIVENTFILVVQVNGKVRAQIEVPMNVSETHAKELALLDGNVKKFTSGKSVKKIIYVPGKLVSIVL